MANLCKERYSCSAACCYSPCLNFASEKEAQSFIEQAKANSKIPIEETSEEGFSASRVLVSSSTPPLIIVHPNKRQIQISGPCPFLDNNHNCSIYPERPNACKKFKPGSNPCNQARKRFDLPPVKLDL